VCRSGYLWSFVGYPTETALDVSDPLNKAYINSNAAKTEIAFDDQGAYIKAVKVTPSTTATASTTQNTQNTQSTEEGKVKKFFNKVTDFK